MGSSVKPSPSEFLKGGLQEAKPSPSEFLQGRDSLPPTMGEEKPSPSQFLQGEELSDPLFPVLPGAPQGEGDGWILGALRAVKDFAVDQGKTILQTARYSGSFNPTVPVFPAQGGLYEDIVLGQGGDPAAKERLRRGLEGAAMLGSSVVGEGAAAAIGATRFATGVAAPLWRRGLAWLGAQEAGAAAYSAVAPLAEGQTREEKFVESAWMFPATGALLHGVVRVTGATIDAVMRRLRPNIRAAAEAATPEQAQEMAGRFREYMRQVGPVPKGAEEATAAEGMARATKETMRLGMPPDEQMARSYEALRKGEAKKYPNPAVRAAALAEKMRGREFTRVEFDTFIKDWGEDGPYMAMRKWAEPPGARRTRATAKAETQPLGEEPDFTVEDLEPPPPTAPARVPEEPPPPPMPQVLREDLGVPTEAQLQEELETLIPKARPKVPPDLEAEARVREARETPFPGREPGEPLLVPEEPPPVTPPPGAREVPKEPPWSGQVDPETPTPKDIPSGITPETPLSEAAASAGPEDLPGIHGPWPATKAKTVSPRVPRISLNNFPEAPEELSPVNRDIAKEIRRRWANARTENGREAAYKALHRLFKGDWSGFQKSGRLPTDALNDFLGNVPRSSAVRPSSAGRFYMPRDIVNANLTYKKLERATPITGTSYHVHSVPSPELAARIADSWYAKDLSEALGALTERIIQRMRKVTSISKPRFGGLSGDMDILGSNTDVAFINDVRSAQGASELPGGNANLIHLNPYATFKEISMLKVPLGKDLPRMVAEDVWGTMVHEVAHELESGEGIEHELVMLKIIEASEKQKDAEVESLARLWRQMIPDEMFQRHYAEVGSGIEFIPRERTNVKGVNVLLRSPVRHAAGGDILPSSDIVGGGPEVGFGLRGLVEPSSTQPAGDYASVFGRGAEAGGEDLEGLLAKRLHDPESVPPEVLAAVAEEKALREMPPEEMLGPQEKLEAGEATREIPHEPNQRNPLTQIRQVGDEPVGPEMDAEPGAKSDETLRAEEQKGDDFWRSEEGAVGRQVAGRLAMLGLAGMSEYAAQTTDDPKKQRLFHTVAGFLAFGSLAHALGSKGFKAWLNKPITLTATSTTIKPLYGFVKLNDLARILSDGSKEAMHAWHAATQWGRASGDFLRRSLEPHFPDALSREAGMYGIDEGAASHSWHMMSPQAQSEVMAVNALNQQMLSRMEQMGAIPQGSGRAWFISRLFEDREIGKEWFSKWENLVQYGSPAQAQAFGTLRAAFQWAQARGYQLPMMDPAKAMPHFMEEVTRRIANHQMVEGFKSTGVLVPFDRTRILNQSPQTPSNFQLRQVRVPGLGPAQMATDEAATLLERAYGAKDFGGFLATLDKARGLMMRSIMFWAWEHGINGLRAAWAASFHPLAYREALRAIRGRDPGFLEFSRYADPLQHTDWGSEAQGTLDKVMEEATKRFGAKFPTLARVGAGIEHWRTASERKLWNDYIPAIGYLVWTREMEAWTRRTGGRYLLGSPEYIAMARRVGELAGDAMGKIPKLLVDPKVAYATRQALFSPNWTRTRINLSLKAGAEAARIAGGELEPQDALYLPFKLRSVLIGVALTTIGSLVLTGVHSAVTGRGKPELPQFNPNTNKFYMRTGFRDHNRREVGIDLAGWYQDDTKMFNDPWAYLRDRQNPLLRTAMTLVSGRDVFGRPVEGVGRVEQVMSGLGPPGELISTAGKIATSNTAPGDLIRAATGIAAVGNVSALPTMADARAEAVAAEILHRQGLPADKDRVYQLGVLIKRNVAQGVDPYAGDVPFWIAGQRRAHKRTGWPWLWDQKKKDFRNWLNHKPRERTLESLITGER